jgi:cystathionine beta-lyase
MTDMTGRTDLAALAALPGLDVSLSWLHSKPGVKWHSSGPDVIAAWVADMDFPAPSVVREALAALSDGGDLGYPAWLLDEGTPLRQAFAARMSRLYGWSPDPGHVREFTDIQQALQAVLHVATAPGDAVAMNVPCYPPFLDAAQVMGRAPVLVPLRHGDGSWLLDTERLARDVSAHRVRTLILVNPHNPTGRCFTKPELEAVAAVAQTHDLLVISDEIHADLTYPPSVFVPFASLSAETAARTVTLTSASKAFNMSGMRCAVAHVGAAPVRAALGQLPPGILGEISVAGVVATLAAWRDGDRWLARVRALLDRNRHQLAASLAPCGIGYHPPQATYLAWLDFRALGLPGEPAPYLRAKAKVRLSSGPGFGPGCEGFARLNFATSPPVLGELCERIAAALADR